MARPSNKEKLLADGLRVVHERGFGASSVRDITQAAGVPQGSFTNHFASKEAFGLEIVDAVLLTYPDAGHGSLFQYPASFTKHAAAFLSSDSESAGF